MLASPFAHAAILSQVGGAEGVGHRRRIGTHNGQFCRCAADRDHLVEIELVALDVLHHHARLVVLIGGQ
jgi:chemotaxis receptor (MCP) glutamine deamidase CheD